MFFLLMGMLQEAGVRPLHKPADAHALAVMDIALLPPEVRPWTRYIWVRNGDVLDTKTAVWASNWLTGVRPYRPPVIGGGLAPTLVRLDLRRLAYNEGDLKRWTATWEEFTFDPSFSLLFTHDSLKLLLDAGWEKPKWLIRLLPSSKQIAVTAPSFKAVDGKTYTEKWVSVVRQPHLAIDQGTLAILERSTGSTAPVVESDYFLNRAMASINGGIVPSADDEVFKTLYGGLYYELAGVPTAKSLGKKKGTDFDCLFEYLGIIDNADGDVKAFDKLAKLGSEQRVAMLKSAVTGKRRAVFILPTLKSVRFQGVVFVTMDVKDNNIDILTNPFMNLLDFRGDAMEVRWNEPNGSIHSALYNKAGVLQREVPHDIADDNTIPDPYTKRLDTISCEVCHGGKGNDGWQTLKNDAADNLPSLLAELGDKKKRDAAAQTYEKYEGNADELLMGLRRRTIGAVLEMTGPWDVKDNENQTGVYRLAAGQLGKIRERFRYTPINAGTMLRELGYDVGKEAPVDYMVRLLPPEGEFEDIRIKQLMQGKALPRVDADLVKGFIAGRLQANIALQRKEKVP